MEKSQERRKCVCGWMEEGTMNKATTQPQRQKNILYLASDPRLRFRDDANVLVPLHFQLPLPGAPVFTSMVTFGRLLLLCLVHLLLKGVRHLRVLLCHLLHAFIGLLLLELRLCFHGNNSNDGGTTQQQLNASFIHTTNSLHTWVYEPEP